MIEDLDQQNMATTATTTTKRSKSDPRDEDFIIKYDKSNFSKGDQEGGMAEFYQLISVMIGFAAFITRQKWTVWVALFFYYTSSVNARSDARLQHILTGISIVLIAFVNIYMSPEPGAAPPMSSRVI